MPLILSSANAYATLAEAEDYALTLPVANDWATATEAQKNAALVQATRLLDTLGWKGRRTSQAQPLQWPRAGATDREGYTLDSATVPARVRDAACEFAIRLVADDRVADAGGLAPETLKVGPLDLGPMRRSPIPASVLEMVRELLAHGYGSPRMVLG